MLFNPLDLRGPEFLLFYLVFGVVVILILRLWIIVRETRFPVPKLKHDPYEIAYLRGGKEEAIRVAIFSLLDRGLLQARKGKVKLKNEAALDLARRPIERSLLEHFKHSKDIDDTYEIDPSGEYQVSLKKNKLIADEQTFSERMLPIGIGLGVVGGLGAWKVCLAISRGRYNILFLLLQIAIYLFWLHRMARRERTYLGMKVLEDLSTLFERLEARKNTLPVGGATNEAAIVAAVFGLSAISTSRFPFMKDVYPDYTPTKRSSSASSSSSWSCSTSSCSSGSSCSSCGGGCGGGGCGGCGS